MKILNIITDLAMGGTEITLEKIILNDKGNEHIIICLNDSSPIGERLSENKIKLIDLKINNIFSGFIAVYKIFLFLIENKNINVVQGWMYHGNFVAFLVNLFLRKKLIWNIRQSLDNLSVEKKTTQNVILISKFLSNSKLLNKIIYNSAKAKEDHEKMGFVNHKSQIIFNGYLTSDFEKEHNHKICFLNENKLPLDTILVGHIARLHPVKDHVNFILTAKKLLTHKKNFFFIMIGREVNSKKIKNILYNLNIAKNFILISEKKRTSDYFKIFDLTVNSSWAEAFPNVVAESILFKTPCFATKVGDASRILDFNDAFLAEPRNPLILSNKILNYINLNNDEKNEAMNKIYKNLTKKFTIEILIKNYNQAYLN